MPVANPLFEPSRVYSWCVLEMFTFLRSGGTIDRIILKPLDPDDRKVLATFDIRKADCFLQSDKQRLLSIVESSYFSSGAFNAACRKILVTKLRLDEAPSSVGDRSQRRAARASDHPRARPAHESPRREADGCMIN